MNEERQLLDRSALTLAKPNKPSNFGITITLRAIRTAQHDHNTRKIVLRQSVQCHRTALLRVLIPGWPTSTGRLSPHLRPLQCIPLVGELGHHIHANALGLESIEHSHVPSN